MPATKSRKSADKSIFVKSPGAQSPSPAKSKSSVVEGLAAKLKKKKLGPATEDEPVHSLSTKAIKSNKKSSRTKVPTPPPVDVEESALEGEAEDEPELFGFSSDDADSSDEEDNGDGADITLDGIDITKLPTITKDDATVRRKLEKAKRKPTEDLGVIYIGRLPHGFYEDQLRAYFSQFGTVTRLRLSRNKKTGASKHYAFIEFDSSSVAKIVVETMDNYLLMSHLLQCKFIPASEVHPQLWIGANKKWKVIPRARVEKIKFEKERDEDEKNGVERRLVKRQNEKKRKIKEAGIDYVFDNVAYVKKPKVAT